MRIGTAIRTGALIAILLALTTSQAGRDASADDSTPVPEGSTPVATVISVVPTMLATVASLPTVIEEGSTPVATSVDVPTAIPTVAAVREVPTAVPPTPTPVPAAPTAAPVATSPPPSVSWPSPQQLREDARLRWGNGIPASVRRWAFLIVPAAKRYHLDPNLIAAVMTMESNGDPLAWSSADARGLMQILHGPWDPRVSVFEGARMLSKLWDRYQDWTLVLAAYNAGPGAVDQYGGVPPYRETRDYVIIVGYLWDLYSHHRISLQRRSLFRKSLQDLRKFGDQRKKVTKLATIGHVNVDGPDLCADNSCVTPSADQMYDTLDPFWPVGGAPDPLQLVGPYAKAP